jgi:hypothetical protein
MEQREPAPAAVVSIEICQQLMRDTLGGRYIKPVELRNLIFPTRNNVLDTGRSTRVSQSLQILLKKGHIEKKGEKKGEFVYRPVPNHEPIPLPIGAKASTLSCGHGSHGISHPEHQRSAHLKLNATPREFGYRSACWYHHAHAQRAL